MSTTRPLTDRQKAAMGRIRRAGGYLYLSPDLAKQLVARGLVRLTGNKHTRREWNRPAATLWEVALVRGEGGV